MNERIQKLYNQAAIYAKNKYTLPEEIEDFAYCVPEKFAELIVRECATVITNALEDGPWPGKLLKEHFGVEE